MTAKIERPDAKFTRHLRSDFFPSIAAERYPVQKQNRIGFIGAIHGCGEFDAPIFNRNVGHDPLATTQTEAPHIPAEPKDRFLSRLFRESSEAYLLYRWQGLNEVLPLPTSA